MFVLRNFISGIIIKTITLTKQNKNKKCFIIMIVGRENILTHFSGNGCLGYKLH